MRILCRKWEKSGFQKKKGIFSETVPDRMRILGTFAFWFSNIPLIFEHG